MVEMTRGSRMVMRSEGLSCNDRSRVADRLFSGLAWLHEEQP